MAIINQPDLLGSAFAAIGDKNTIPATNDGSEGLASQSLGFPPITEKPLTEGGIPPRRDDVNGVLNLLSQHILFRQSGGQYQYDTQLDYTILQTVAYGGNLWVCKQPNGPSTGIQSPALDSAYWELLTTAPITGATAYVNGKSGTVPEPMAGQENSLLAGDGAFHRISSQEEAAGVDNVTIMTPLRVKQILNQKSGNIRAATPIGVIYAFAGNGAVPNGYLLCDGSAVSRTTYSELFAVIGGTYGAGDGSTTFNLPPLNNTNRFLEPSGISGNFINAGLPNIWGQFVQGSPYSGNVSGAFYLSGQAGPGGDNKDPRAICHIDAARCSSVYGASATVQPPAITMRYIIKAKATE